MSLSKKIFFVFVLILIIVLVGILIFLKSTAPNYKGTILSKDVKGSILIERNRWGIPKIEADNLEDLFFAIGYLHAQDRLFQMDLSRRLAKGELSEVFGKIAFETDKFHKELLLDESIDENYETLKKDQKVYSLIKSYCRGVNYFIKNGKLPIEFKILKYRPSNWEIKDVLAILKNMEVVLEDSGAEITNMNLIRIFGKERGSQLIYGNFGSSIVNEKEYEKIYGGKTLSKLMEIEKRVNEKVVGSNNWVVSGSKTDTGKPYLANDPHLPIKFPGYFYQIVAKVRGTDIELSGNTLAGIPLIVIGRNHYLGWGFTNVGTDVIDYFILKTNPDNKNQYLLDGKWVDFKIIEKKIKVKGEGEKTVKVKTSVFGPVIEKNGVSMARHSVLLYPTHAYKGIFIMNFSKNIDEFIKGVSYFTAPAQNIVFADRKGNIGYYPSGAIPKRSKGDGALPVEVTKLSESWQGFYEEREKPILINPDKGYIITANNPVLPEEKLPIFSKRNYVSFRADRIEELFKKKRVFTINDMKAIQLDPFSKPAEFLISSIKNFNYKDEKVNFILNKFKNWDFKMNKGISPFLFYRFERYLAREIFSDDIKREEDKKFISVFWLYRIMKYPKFKNGESFKSWVDDKNTPNKENFKDIVERALLKTYEEYKRESEKRSLKWEDIHKILYRHPLGRVKLLGYFFNRGPFPIEGGRSTILREDFNPFKNFYVTGLSTFRMILDFSNLSKSILVNSTGQSGNFLSPFYDDQISLYVNLKYRIMDDFSEIKYRIIIKPER